MIPPLREARVLFVGAGGLASPAAQVLVRSGLRRLTVCDDDRVDASNLHRQTLYTAADVGRPKAAAAVEALLALKPIEHDTCNFVAREIRIRPETALDLINSHDLVIEGGDNYPTKFLVADACAISRVPVVHAGAIRWGGWAMGSAPDGGPCLRCVFEDIPRGPADSCASAGVVGPVVGVLGALQASIALRMLAAGGSAGRTDVTGSLYSYRGLRGAMRVCRVRPNPACPLCTGEIQDLSPARYTPSECAA